MKHPFSLASYRSGAAPTKVAKSPVDFLHSHDKVASLLPTVQRIVALQKDCTAILPTLFEWCTVLILESEQLVLAAPNAALATKLKHQLPKLQENLRKRGWQVNGIRIKVQVSPEIERNIASKKLILSRPALSAWRSLDDALADSSCNQGLKSAIGEMMQRHQYAEKDVDAP